MCAASHGPEKCLPTGSLMLPLPLRSGESCTTLIRDSEPGEERSGGGRAWKKARERGRWTEALGEHSQ